MSKLRSLLACPALALALVAGPAEAFVKRETPSAPPESYQGQWYTTPDGCSYSRAKAPGYQTMWVLILNPHHIGQPNAGPHCATILEARG